jgi:hypothetical protein
MYLIVDGKWSNWGDWTSCQGDCGTGRRTREHRCNNPPSSNGGQDCEGLEVVEEACETNVPCPSKGVLILIRIVKLTSRAQVPFDSNCVDFC